jgi:O-antigen/teichoic acid export membrane protein
MSLAGGVLSLMIYARMLGPQTYGRLAVYLALVEAFQAICFQWHRLALVRYWAARENAEDDSYLATSHIAWLLVALIGVVTWSAVLSLREGDHVELMSVIMLALAKSAALYTQEMARASGAIVRYAIASLLLTLGATSAGIAAWTQTRSMTLTLDATAAVFLMQTVLCGYDHVRVLGRARFNSPQFLNMLRYGLPLLPVFVATTALTRLDRPILAAFEGARVVGVYAAASGLVSNAISAACLLIVTPSYPWLLKEKTRRSDAEHRSLHARIGLLMLGGMLAMCVMLLLVQDVALPAMLGHVIGLDAQPLVLPLLVIAVIGAFRTHFFDQSYHLHSRTTALMIINLSTLVVATAAVYSGARLGGCNGMLAGLLVANCLSLALSATFSRAIVDLSSVAKGGVSLVAIAALAIGAGHLSRIAMTGILHVGIWPTCVSAGVGIVIFALLYFGGNVGSIRGVVVGRL